MRRRRKSGVWGWLWISLGAVVLLLVLAGLGVSLWASGYLRGPEFRRLIEDRLGASLGGEAELQPLRWQGAGVYSGAASVRGGNGAALRRLEAGQLRARVDWRAIFGGAWRVEAVEALNLSAEFGPGGAGSFPVVSEAGRAGGGARVEMGVFRAGSASLSWEDDVRLEGTALEIRPEGSSWELRGSGGTLDAGLLQGVRMSGFRGRMAPGTFFLTSSEGALPEGGTLSASGEFGADSLLRVEWRDVNASPLLSEEWRDKLSGILSGKAGISWPRDGPGSVVGSFVLTEGRLKDVPLLEQIATFTGSPQFRRMPLHQVSGNFTRTDGGDWEIQDFLLESKGLLSAAGSMRVAADGALEGSFEIGVTPQVLQWIPGSRERVFTRNENGYVWTSMRLAGTLHDPKEDLSARLLLAARDEAIRKGTRILEQPADTLRDGAQGILDALSPLLR